MLQEINETQFYRSSQEGRIRPRSYCMLRQHDSLKSLENYLRTVDSLFIKGETVLNSSNQQVLKIDTSRKKNGSLLLKDLQENQALWNIQIIPRCFRPAKVKVSLFKNTSSLKNFHDLNSLNFFWGQLRKFEVGLNTTWGQIKGSFKLGLKIDWGHFEVSLEIAWGQTGRQMAIWGWHQASWDQIGGQLEHGLEVNWG